MARTTNGGGNAAKNTLTPAQQDEVRRAAKLRRSRSIGTAAVSGGFVAGLQADRAAEREARKLAFRQLQAKLVLEMIPGAGLSEAARAVAEAIVVHFVDDVVVDPSQGRTLVAIEAAKADLAAEIAALTGAERARAIKAQERGVGWARWALKQAFEEARRTTNSSS